MKMMSELWMCDVCSRLKSRRGVRAKRKAGTFSAYEMIRFILITKFLAYKDPDGVTNGADSQLAKLWPLFYSAQGAVVNSYMWMNPWVFPGQLKCKISLFIFTYSASICWYSQLYAQSMLWGRVWRLRVLKDIEIRSCWHGSCAGCVAVAVGVVFLVVVVVVVSHSGWRFWWLSLLSSCWLLVVMLTAVVVGCFCGGESWPTQPWASGGRYWPRCHRVDHGAWSKAPLGDSNGKLL